MGAGFGSARAIATTRFSGLLQYQGITTSSCVLRCDMTLACNGYDEFGNNGNGMLTYHDGALRSVMGTFSIVDLPVGYGNRCAIQRSGTVVCWG
jgi:hypothetical protein